MPGPYPALLDVDLDDGGRPAATESAAAVAGIIVRDHLQRILARLGELHRRDRLAMEWGLAVGELLESRFRFVDGHLTRTAVLAHRQRDRRTRIAHRRVGPTGVLHIVAGINLERHRDADRGRSRRRVAQYRQRPLHGLAVRFETDNRRRVTD